MNGFVNSPTRTAAGWLSLAAAPTFALMAVATSMFGGGMPGMICSTMQPLSLDGMVPMYVLMSVFHSTPWLRLFSTRGEPYQKNVMAPECGPPG